ncbi:MAG: Spy/CpxP family protein refolding chaperone [Candidatus Aminicenantaceae bacterium]
MKKSTLAWLMVAGLLTFTGMVLASSQMGQEGRGFRQSRPGMGQVQRRGLRRARSGGILMALEARQEELNITDEQLDKIKELSLKLEEKRVEQQNSLNTQRLEQRKLMMDRENLDYDRLKDLLLKNSESKVDLMIDSMRLRDQIDTVLTPEQKDALKDMGRDRMDQRRSFTRSRDPRRDSRPRRSRRAPEDIQE